MPEPTSASPDVRRAALDAHFARATGRPNSGLADYIQRLRQEHCALVVDGRYRGCACGEIACGKDFLLAWVDEGVRSYEAKVQDFAAETRRADRAVAELAALRERGWANGVVSVDALVEAIGVEPPAPPPPPTEAEIQELRDALAALDASDSPEAGT